MTHRGGAVLLGVGAGEGVEGGGGVGAQHLPGRPPQPAERALGQPAVGEAAQVAAGARGLRTGDERTGQRGRRDTGAGAGQRDLLGPRQQLLAVPGDGDGVQGLRQPRPLLGDGARLRGDRGVGLLLALRGGAAQPGGAGSGRLRLHGGGALRGRCGPELLVGPRPDVADLRGDLDVVQQRAGVVGDEGGLQEGQPLAAVAVERPGEAGQLRPGRADPLARRGQLGDGDGGRPLGLLGGPLGLLPRLERGGGGGLRTGEAGAGGLQVGLLALGLLLELGGRRPGRGRPEDGTVLGQGRCPGSEDGEPEQEPEGGPAQGVHPCTLGRDRGAREPFGQNGPRRATVSPRRGAAANSASPSSRPICRGEAEPGAGPLGGRDHVPDVAEAVLAR